MSYRPEVSGRKAARVRVQILGLAAAVVLVRALFSAATGITFEDSLISLRYAENLASGFGMVFNPGERVFGASTPLYVLLLAGLTRLGLPALAIARGMAALTDGITCWLWGAWLLRRTGTPWAAWLFGILFGLSAFMVQVSVSGMETSFALLLLTLALIADLEDRPVRLGLSLGLLMLVRPDGALAVLVLLGFRWLRTRRFPWLPAALAVGLVLPWLLGAAWYYGSPVPNSIPAKAAAYNLHRPSMLPNLLDTLGHLTPTRGPVGRQLANWILLPCLAAGLVYSWRMPRLRPLGTLFLAWWAYLVLPKTLLFTWYFPIFLLPAYVLAALGFAGLREGARTHPRGPEERTIRLGSIAVLSGLAVCLGCWLTVGSAAESSVLEKARRVQQAEEEVRKPLGLWLRDHTDPDARIAVEPIGYIGYYSRRRLLDEVGLVSPVMIPLNRAGAGWFSEMLRRFSPEYVVERPGYLLRNLTINSRVPMFGDRAEREEFLARYRAVAVFSSPSAPELLKEAYHFVVYARRSAAEESAWRDYCFRLSEPARQDFLTLALLQPVELPETRSDKAKAGPQRRSGSAPPR